MVAPSCLPSGRINSLVVLVVTVIVLENHNSYTISSTLLERRSQSMDWRVMQNVLSLAWSAVYSATGDA